MTRVEQAMQLRRAGKKAYSDAFNRVIVSYGNAEHGYDVLTAVLLRADLDRAIEQASLMDDELQEDV